MTGEVLPFRRPQKQESQESEKTNKEKQLRGCLVDRVALLALAAGIPTGFYGFVAPSKNLTKHLEEPLVDSFDFLLKYKDEIVDAGDHCHVPPEMIAGVIVKENWGRWLLEDWKDTTALAWNNTVGQMTGKYADPSLGVGQVNVQTARSLSRKYEHQEKSVEEIQKELENPENNIEYVAMMLSNIMDRENRRLRGASLFDDPEMVAIIATEYVIGPTATPLKDAEPNREGIYFVQNLGRTPCNRIFGNHATITEQQQFGLRTYAEEHSKDDNIQAVTADAYKALLPPPLLPI